MEVHTLLPRRISDIDSKDIEALAEVKKGGFLHIQVYHLCSTLLFYY